MNKGLFLLFIPIVLPFAIYFYARLIVPLKFGPKARIVWAFSIVLFSSLLVAAIPMTLQLARSPELFDTLRVLSWLPWVYYGITFICILFAFTFIRDIVHLGIKFFRLIVESRRPPRTPDQIMMSTTAERETMTLSRRQFMQRAGTVALTGTALAATPVAVYRARSMRTVRRVDVALPAIPPELEGFRIAHLSDIHVGNTIRREDIADIVAETNALEPDLIAITGDMADGIPDVIGSWLDPMRDFAAPNGTFFVTGNHDHMWDGMGWCRTISALGIHVLNNTSSIINVRGARIAVAGAIDHGGDRKIRAWHSDPEAALSGLPDDIFKLMLVHQPASVDRSFAAGAHLVLLGHTHGGQFWPLSIVVSAVHRYFRGLYHFGDHAAYVSCGTGYWGPPIRFGVPPEICLITLHHAHT